MFIPEPHNIFNNAQDSLSWHISHEEFTKALQILIERKKEIPAFRRWFYFSCIRDGLSGYKSHRHVTRTAKIMIIVNLLIQPLFSVQLLDAFAFLLPQRFLYYNYFSALIPHILNTFFLLSLIFQWQIWVALPARLFERRVHISYSAGFFTLIALVCMYTAFCLIPFAADLPMVRNGDYLSRSISEEEMVAMVYGQVIRSAPDRKDVADTLIKELQDKYGRTYPLCRTTCLGRTGCFFWRCATGGRTTLQRCESAA